MEKHFYANRLPWPPQVVFRTRIYHCNVNASGQICLGALNTLTARMTLRCTIGLCCYLPQSAARWDATCCLHLPAVEYEVIYKLWRLQTS